MTRLNFSGGWEREIEREIQGAMQGIARDFERKMNELSRTMQGQPLPIIKTRIRAALSKDGGSITDPELTEYAEAVQAGTTFHADVGKARFH